MTTTPNVFEPRQFLKLIPPASPAFIYDENRIMNCLSPLMQAGFSAKCKILFPLKSFCITDALHIIAPEVDGFSASSVFEAKLARTLLKGGKLVHFTTPGFKPEEFYEISKLSDYISFNSFSQLKRFSDGKYGSRSCGLRINPQLSFIYDSRYNPCRRHSKLGVPLNQFSKLWQNKSEILKEIDGIFFHTNCDSKNLEELSKTVLHIDEKLPGLLEQINWINLGGGYLFDSIEDLNPLMETVTLLKAKYNLDVFFEPGKAIVGTAGYIVSTVLDIFESEGKKIAVVDTTVNHMPEVFEYQFEPDVVGHVDAAPHNYILAGCTCLAGDRFGQYSFLEPLEIGSRVIFENVGAYTLVKSHMFNGVNLPDIYSYTKNGELKLIKQFTYDDFLARCAGESNADKRKAVNCSNP